MEQTDIINMLGTAGKHISVFAPVTKGGEKTLLDIIEAEKSVEPDDSMLKESLCREVKRVLATLTQRESDVISLYFGLQGKGRHSLTLEEIGEQFCITRERVRQIKEKAIRRLRHTSRSKALKPYLG